MAWGRDGSLIVPPTYVAYALVQGRPLGDIGVDGLFAGDPSLLAIPRLGEAWETAERAVSTRLSAACGMRRPQVDAGTDCKVLPCYSVP